MTVCAWDGRHLVTDGESYLDVQIAQTDAVKLHHFNHSDMGPCVAAMAGTVSDMRPWLNHMESRGFDAFSSDADCDGLIVTRSGQAYQAYASGGFFEPRGFAAIGAGALLATAALRDGADAIEAVRYAIRHHVYCGGTIRAYDWQANVIARIKE